MSDISEEREKELLEHYGKSAWTALPEDHPDRMEVFALCNIGSLVFDPSIGKEGSVRLNTEETEIRYCLNIEMSAKTHYAHYKTKVKASYEGIYNKEILLNILKSQFVRQCHIHTSDFDKINTTIKLMRNNCKVQQSFNRDELKYSLYLDEYIKCSMTLDNDQIRALSHRQKTVGYHELENIINSMGRIEGKFDPENDFRISFNIQKVREFQIPELNHMIKSFIEQAIKEYNALPEEDRLA